MIQNVKMDARIIKHDLTPDLATYNWDDANKVLKLRTFRVSLSNGIGLDYPFSFRGISAIVSGYISSSDIGSVHIGSMVRVRFLSDTRNETVFTGRITDTERIPYGTGYRFTIECAGLNSWGKRAPEIWFNTDRSVEGAWGIADIIDRNNESSIYSDPSLPLTDAGGYNGMLGVIGTIMRSTANLPPIGETVSAAVTYLSEISLMPSVWYESGNGRLVILDAKTLYESIPAFNTLKRLIPRRGTEIKYVNKYERVSLGGPSREGSLQVSSSFIKLTLGRPSSGNIRLNKGWNEFSLNALGIGGAAATFGNVWYFGEGRETGKNENSAIISITSRGEDNPMGYVWSDSVRTINRNRINWDGYRSGYLNRTQNFTLSRVRFLASDQADNPDTDGIASIPIGLLGYPVHPVMNEIAWNTFARHHYPQAAKRVSFSVRANDSDNLLYPSDLLPAQQILVQGQGNKRYGIKQVRWLKETDGLLSCSIIADDDLGFTL